MSKSRHTEAEMIGALKQLEAGAALYSCQSLAVLHTVQTNDCRSGSITHGLSAIVEGRFQCSDDTRIVSLAKRIDGGRADHPAPVGDCRLQRFGRPGVGVRYQYFGGGCAYWRYIISPERAENSES